MIDHYAWSGGREAMLRFGPSTGPVAVVGLPLFEEANRVRAFAVTICRALAKRGVGSVLPDLPGQGESMVAAQETTLANLRHAFAAVSELLFDQGRHVYSTSLRSGALVDADSPASGRWHLSPTSGRDVLQDLGRILKTAGRDEDVRRLRTVFQAEEPAFPMEIAGNLLGSALLEELTTDHGTYPLRAIGIPRRVVRLDTDPAPAHLHLPGMPLWRRAEPDNDPALAALLADDIADWIAACDG